VDVDPTPFNKRVFGIMDEDGSGEMDFREFVVATWNYCSFEKTGLIHFTYDLYDSDRNGTMSVDECKAMFVEVYGQEFGKANKGLRLFETIEGMASDHERTFDIITIPQFTTLINTHVNVLMPAFQMQSAIQSKVLGRRFWGRITRKRLNGMGAAEWKKHIKGHRTKLNTNTVLQKYREAEAQKLLDRLRKNYKSSLIGRLGEYNPNLDTERRKNVVSKSKEINYESFEELHHMRSKVSMPPVLEPEILPGYQTATRIDKTEMANRPVWREDIDYRGVETAKKDVEDIMEWQREIKAAKEVTKFESGAPEGYSYKGNIEHGPLIKLKVDESSRLVDWKTVKVHAFQSSLDEEDDVSIDSEEKKEVERVRAELSNAVEAKKKGQQTKV